MAPWWGRAAMMAIVVFFGWVIREGLASTTGDVWIRTIIPAYGVLLYAAVACLINRRSMMASPDQFMLTNGPIPVGGTKVIPRNDIAFAYYLPVETMGDSGGTVVLWYLIGIETYAGRSVEVIKMFKTPEAARAAAQRIADALSARSDHPRVVVRQIPAQRVDPADKRVIMTWTGVVVGALAAGLAWELVHRS